ncbi:MAG: 30S ribosomal protein S7 [Candidatus Zixiibacteriota bacterium]|jgi:small subunit ribosomal protein S7|nr:MAG: 30S ribosomal protein S7 [candidate division Zixibacteria bacterium]
MPRRKTVTKRELATDPKYDSLLAAQFINGLMRRGKKSLAEKIFYRAIDIIHQKTGQPGMEVFQKGVNNVKPYLEVKSRRVGGATYQVPLEVRPARRNALAIRWMVTFAKQRSDNTMAERLAAEITAASQNEGAAIKKKDDTHRMAEANKAFAHFRW